jgi:O-antigen/teichoic acid export membrane protein
MIRLLAFGGYVFQSATAIVLIFVVSHLLPPASYTSFSLALASSQLLCVFMFEWLQLAGVRFLAAAEGDDAARLRSSLFAAGLLSTVVLVSVGSAVSLIGTLAPRVVALGLAIAVLQGLADMYFMAIRVSDRLGTAASLLILRASLLLVGAVAGASVYGTAEATLLGIVCGHATSLIAGLFAHRTPLRRPSHRAMLTDWMDFSRYGMLAAGASVIHLSVPVIIRFIVVSSLGAAAPTATAAFSMAIDLLQRPFSVLVAAIHTVSYPEVVIQFERGTDDDARRATSRLLDFILCATVVMLGGLIGFLPDASRLFVPTDLLTGFLAVAPAAAVFYFLHTHLQATLAVIPHLRKAATRLVVMAACQLALVSLVSSIAAALGLPTAAQLASAAVATVIVILCGSGPIVRFGVTPRWLLLGVSIVAAILIGAFAAFPSEPMLWLAGKIVISAMAVALVAWQGEFLSAGRADQGPDGIDPPR